MPLEPARRRALLPIVLALALVWLPTAAAEETPAPAKAKPAKADPLVIGTFPATPACVVDGDTLVLDNLGRVRLIGMNTPEVVAPAQRQGAPPQCYGPEASAATKALL